MIRAARNGTNGTILVASEEGAKDSRWIESLRRIWRTARAGVNRRLHPGRRQRLSDRLSDMAPVTRVLVLCMGNICRSPYGAARLTDLGKRDGNHLEIRSAGLIGPGRPSPDNALSAAAQRGLDLSQHESRLLDSASAAWAELVVVMTPGQARTVADRFGVSPERVVILGDLDPGLPDRRDIPDPVDRSEAFFLEVYDRMDLCLAELVTLIRDPS